MSEENISDAQRKLTEAMQQQALDYARYGQMQVTTSDQLRDAQVQAATGMRNFTAAGGMAGKAIGALAGAGVAAAAEMYKGKKGMGAFNSSLDSLSEAATLAGAALTLLMPGGIIMKAVIGGLTMAATAAIAYTKAANDMSDKLYKSYSGLQQAGGAAADGMTGVFEDAKKLGLSMDQLDSMVSLVAANSQDLAAFSGSVSQGRKQLANMGQSLKGTAEEFYKMGMSQEMVNEGLANYLRVQTRNGRAQTMNTDQLAASARNYIMEQDKLAQITGLNAKQQQDIRESALNEEQFLAKTMDMRARGQNKAADEMETFNVLVTSMGEGVAKGIRASVNGNLMDEAAQKLNFSAAGKQNEIIRKIQSGQMSAAQGAQELAKALGKYATGTGRALGTIQAGETVGIKLSEAERARRLADNNFEEQAADAAADLEKRRKGAGDKLVDAQGNLIKGQRDINEKLERDVLKGIPNAQANMARLANVTDTLADGFTTLTNGINRLLKLIGLGEKEPAKPKEMTKSETAAAAATSDKRNTAKPLQDKVDMMAKELDADEKALKDAKRAGKFGDELKPLEEKILKNKKEYDIAAKQLLAAEKEIAQAALEEQKLRHKQTLDRRKLARLEQDNLNDAEAIRDFNEEKANLVKAGKDTSSVDKKIKQRQNNIAGRSAEVGQLQTDLKTSTVGATDKSLAFTGASGSKSNFEQLNPVVKDKVVAASQQYNADTGNKITVNSAKRDSADQQRLWDESKQAGREGKTESGMPIAKPGTSKHEQGLAIDIQNYNDPAAVSAMNRQGLKQTVPNDPVHFEIPSAEEGGIVSGPASGYQTTMHGTEAVIPMQNNSGDFVKMFETMAAQSSRMADMLETLVRAQQTGNDISTKILRQQA